MGGPNYVVMEKRRVNKLLQANLKPVEKAEILRQLQALDLPPKPEPKPRPKPSPYFFGVFGRPRPTEADRPKADPDRPKPSEPDRKGKEPARPETTTIASTESALPVQPPAPEGAQPEPGLEPPSADDIKALASQVADIADRIIWLRSFWATTLSPDVQREAEAWLLKLQLLASKLKAVAPPEVLEQAMGGQSYLLSQPVREYRKPTMTQQVQERVMPSSVPNSMNAQINDDFYRMIEANRRPVVEQRDASYLPDGLQSFVA